MPNIRCSRMNIFGTLKIVVCLSTSAVYCGNNISRVLENEHSPFLNLLTKLADFEAQETQNTIYRDAESPGYISFNVNPYKQLYNSLFDGRLTNVYSRGHTSRANLDTFPRSDVDGHDDKNIVEHIERKRLYIPKEHDISSVSKYDRRKFPYNNVVKLSSGCTGTLLTSMHVLTAAHCVHNGVNFKNKMEMLKVEVSDKIGYRIHYIVKINVPVTWLRARTIPEIARGSFDFAVLELSLPVTGRDKFMQLSLPTSKMLNANLHFLSFFPKRSNGLWHSTCKSDESYVLMRGNVILRKCDYSEFGNSGAAMYTHDAVEGLKVIGVLSNTISLTTGGLNAVTISYDSVMLLTWPKLLDICAMMYPNSEKYDICKQVNQNNMDHLQMASNKIMTFFG